MEKHFFVLNFQIPTELKDLYEDVSKEFDSKTYNATKPGGQNEIDQNEFTKTP